MKKLLTAGILVVVSALAAAIALPWIISSDAVRENLLSTAREITGREMRFSGDPTVSFSPFLGIEIKDVSFLPADGGDTPILSMPTLRGRLSLASAIRGNVVVDEYQFVRPRFNIDVFSDGTTSWAFPEGEVWKVLAEAQALREATETGQEPDLSQIENSTMGRFSVVDAMVTYRDLRHGREETVTNVNGTLVWPTTRADWRFDGSGIWRGDTVTLRLDTEAPIMLLAGGTSTATAEIASEPLNLSFEGDINRLADFYFNGTIEAASPSLRRTIEFLGGNPGVGASFGEFTAEGNLSGTLADLQIQNGSYSLDGNSYAGSLRLSTREDSGRRISGTLATDNLDVAPYLSGLTEIAGYQSVYEILNGAELDVRLSANSLRFEKFEVTDFAGGLFARDNSIKIDVGNSALGEGLIVGEFGASRMEDAVGISAKLNASNINPAKLAGLSLVSGVRPDGVANIDLQLETVMKGDSGLSELLDGSFKLSMKQGLLSGFDFAEIRPSLTDGGENNQNVQIGDTLEQTPVSDFVLNATINRGVAWVGDSSFRIEEFSSRISGKADLRTGNLAIWGVMMKPDEGGELRSHSQYFLGGTLGQPLYVPQFGPKSTLDPESKPPLPETDNNTSANDDASTTN